MTDTIDHGWLAIAESWEKNYVEDVVVARGTSLSQGTFISILAPAYHNASNIVADN